MAEILRNRTFLILFLSMLLFASAAGVHQALNNHSYVFVWKLRPETIQVIAYVYLAGILAGVPLTPMLLRRMEKKTVAAIGFSLVAVGWIVLPGLRGLGIFAPIGAAALPWLALSTLIFGVASGLVFIVFPSMMADAAEEHEHLRGSRREGLFFSGLGFAGKAASGMGMMIGGFALDLAAFPARRRPASRCGGRSRRAVPSGPGLGLDSRGAGGPGRIGLCALCDHPRQA